MKKSAVFVAWSIALTVMLYLLAYFFLPPPPPSASMMVLFAGVAMAVVAAGKWLLRKRQSHKDQPADRLPSFVLLALVLPILASQGGCKAAPPTSSPRVTGFELLAQSQPEAPGYGLYSYILLTHQPDEAEKARFHSFLKAILSLPSAGALGRYVDPKRINITYLLISSMPHDWNSEPIDDRVDFVIRHYDFARAAAIAATLPQATRPGPIIVSALRPIDLNSHPHPVLIQDLSLAQPTLMASYVQEFVRQAAQDQFWEASTLSSFALSLRNVLETAAVATGVSKDAVQSWIKYLS